MKLLFVYTGFFCTTRQRSNPDLLEDLHNFETTHMSEVNALLLCYWLQALGWDVSVLVNSEATGGGTGLQHFPSTKPSQLEEAAATSDAVLLFKTHGLSAALKIGVFKHKWKRITAWLDTLNADRLLGGETDRISHFAWGTPGILEEGVIAHPNAEHVLCEHATVFSSAPKLGQTEPRGLYAGRLPTAYLDQVKLAAEHAPLVAAGLWIQNGAGERLLMRPYQLKEGVLEQARKLVPRNVILLPGQNMISRAEELSMAAFGLCPATSTASRQLASASKFYDYLALGLPAVTASSVPEAAFVLENPYLGVLYDQSDTTGSSLGEAIQLVLRQAKSPDFQSVRKKIQDWVFTHATYGVRAGTLAQILPG